MSKKIQEEKRKGNQERARRPRPRFSDRPSLPFQTREGFDRLCEAGGGGGGHIFLSHEQNERRFLKTEKEECIYGQQTPLKEEEETPFTSTLIVPQRYFFFLETGLSCESGIGSNSMRAHSAIVREV